MHSREIKNLLELEDLLSGHSIDTKKKTTTRICFNYSTANYFIYIIIRNGVTLTLTT